ncbi:hypothetical protein LSH36_422g02055 [Paralvinella palmiformis]|uniref:Uncharacterized protein n=1 Tax=Paralvinella palmiformis TaxID=53620 RepID=A0AAD9JBJ6_9ANNE|nr:hypothetical protein LSH36_422g02055 [Paralvinella palmiformis]
MIIFNESFSFTSQSDPKPSSSRFSTLFTTSDMTCVYHRRVFDLYYSIWWRYFWSWGGGVTSDVSEGDSSVRSVTSDARHGIPGHSEKIRYYVYLQCTPT